MDYLEWIPSGHDLDEERLLRFRKRMEKRQASICSERAVLYTESFQKTEGEPYMLRKAKAFAHTLRHMTVYLEEDSLLFGNQASRSFAAPIFPEYSIDWVIEELDQFDQRNGDVFYITDDVKADLRRIAPYWSGHTHADRVNQNISDTIRLAEKQGVIHRGGISMSGDGHIAPDHALVLTKGFRYLADEARRKWTIEDDSQKRCFYEAVAISIEGVLDYIKRFEPLARKKAEQQTDPKHQQDYLNMAAMAHDLMEQPARSFYEGVQTCYLIHMLQMIESNGHSFSYGRFDQYMYDLYRHDIETGRISKDRALELVTHFFLMNSTNNKVRPYGHTKFSQGYPLYSNLVVGGLKPDGTDGTNELTHLCVEAMNLTKMAEPNFSMRYHDNTPKDILRLAAKLIRTGCGMPSMFHDETVTAGMESIGIPHEDAMDYCPIGCVETGIAGKYGHRATGMTYVNWGKLVELVLYNGYDPDSGIQLLSLDGTASREVHYQTYDQLWDAWKRTLAYYSDLAVECDAVCDASLEIFDADPFASSMIDNCMELGKTQKAGGCKYDVISQSNIGPSVVGNSFMAIKQLVFEQQKLTLAQLKEAMEHNWEGPYQRIHKWCMQVPKFGNDSDEVDAIVKDVFDSYLELLPKYRTARYGRGPEVSCYTMSTSNITSYVPNGFAVGATPDGRMARSPLNEGCSPTQGTDTHGPTAVIRSVSKLPNDKVAAGQLLNMRFAPQALQGEENLDTFVAFLQASARLGIYHNQFNVLDSKTLIAAKQHPQEYTDLIVRVAGYCAQFISLMPQAQDAIIARTENSWRA